jgi:hypothetical protein
MDDGTRVQTGKGGGVVHWSSLFQRGLTSPRSKQNRGRRRGRLVELERTTNYQYMALGGNFSPRVLALCKCVFEDGKIFFSAFTLHLNRESS